MKHTHINALDGLRGVAALIVVVSHSANAGLLPAVLGRGFGQQGVALFYILSGFLIAHLYLDRPLTRTTLTDYAVARIARVLPLFYAVLLASAALWQTTGIDVFLLGSPQSFAAHALLLQGSGRVLWSIPVEIQFYIVFVALWWLRSRGWLLAGLAGLVAFQLATFALTLTVSPEVNVHALPFWLHFFTLGCVIALLQSRAPRVPGWLVAAVLLLMPLALPELRRVLGWPVLANFADPITAGAPVLLFALVVWRRDLFAVLATAPLRFLGRISFGIYLLHYPVLLALPALGLQGVTAFAALLALSILAATFSFFGFERPVQHWLRARYMLRA